MADISTVACAKFRHFFASISVMILFRSRLRSRSFLRSLLCQARQPIVGCAPHSRYFAARSNRTIEPHNRNCMGSNRQVGRNATFVETFGIMVETPLITAFFAVPITGIILLAR